jgi:hypothetical protein
VVSLLGRNEPVADSPRLALEPSLPRVKVRPTTRLPEAARLAS